MDTAIWVSAIANSVTALVALVALCIAWRQLANLWHNLELNRLTTLLGIEAEMNTCKEKVDEKNDEMRPGITVATTGLHRAELNTRLENWFNAVDRFAFCLLADYVPKNALRVLEIRYHDYFNHIVANHQEFFSAGTPYRNILDLNGKWQRQ